MTYDTPETFTSPWPADPASAWAEAVRSPTPIVRFDERPDLDAADADSITDWIEDQRSVLPMFAIAAAAVGAVLVGGLLLGVLPTELTDESKAGRQWVGGIGLLIASIVLWVWEIISRRRRKNRPQPLIPEVQMVLCQLYPTRFQIGEGDGYRETCIAIDADLSDEQASIALTAFRIWLSRLEADNDAAIRARGESWSPSGATVFTSEEIFGPSAHGGYLIRRPNLPADGWGALITPRRPAKLIGQLRFADIRQWNGATWIP